MNQESDEATRKLHRSRIFGEFAWGVAGKGCQAIAQFVGLVWLARLLEPSDFGLAAMSMIVVGVAQVFSQFGVGPALVQSARLDDDVVSAAASITLALGVLSTLGIYLSSPVVAAFFGRDELLPIVQAISLVFVINAMGAVAECLIQRELRIKTITLIELVSYCLGYLAVAVTLASLGFGVWALVLASLVQEAFKTCVLVILYPHPRHLHFRRDAYVSLIRFGGGFTIARFANYLALQGDNIVIGRWLGADALGFYSRAYQLATAPFLIVANTLDRVLFPAMAARQHDKDTLEEIFMRGSELIAASVLPASAFLVIMGPELVTVLLGGKWIEAIVPFQILSAGLLVRMSYRMGDSLAKSVGAVYARAWRQIIYALAVLGLGILGVRWGVNGVAVGVVLAIALNYLLMTHLAAECLDGSLVRLLAANRACLRATLLVLFETLIGRVLLERAEVPEASILAIVGGIVLASIGLVLKLRSDWFMNPEAARMLRSLVSFRRAGSRHN